MKNKHEMREAVIKRLKEHRSFPDYYRELIKTIVGDDLDELTSDECIGRIIYLLTDDEPFLLPDDIVPYFGDEFAKGPRDADGILWSSGDMSDSPWGVIEGVFYDCTRKEWLVRGHDISAPWIPADSIRHAPMRTATQQEDVCRCHNCIATKRNNDLIELLKDAARDYESLQADCRGMSDLKDTCWQKFKDLHEAVDERYIELPRDANGEVIHIGDEVVVNARGRRLTVDGVGRSEYDVIFCADSPGYTAYVAKTCHRYHKLTVDEILDELEGMRGTGDYDDVVERCAYLAGMLRELLKEGEDEDQA